MRGRIGAVRSRAWIWDLWSTHSTTAASGGLRYKPARSRTFIYELGVRGDLEMLGSVRFETERPPYS